VALSPVCEAILQYEGRDTSLGQILGYVGTFVGDGECHKTTARTDHHRRPVSRLRRRLENCQGWLGHVGDDFGVPSFRKVLFFRIVLLCRARRRAEVEGQDILSGYAGREEQHYAKGSSEEFFHGRRV
jgi:hypothetical protein